MGAKPEMRSIKPIAFSKGEVISRGDLMVILKSGIPGPSLPPSTFVHCNFDGGSGRSYGEHFWFSVQECLWMAEETAQRNSTAAMFMLLYNTSLIVKSRSLNI